MTNKYKIDRWNVVHAVLMLLASVLVLFSSDITSILFVMACSITYFIYINLSQFPNDTGLLGGVANRVTVGRLILLLIALGLYNYLHAMVFALVMVLVVCLDGVDGYLARKRKQSSHFGMYLDMEVDAFFVLAMCLFFNINKNVPLWIILPGVLRYIYRIVIELFPAPNFIEKKKKYASIIAGCFFVILLVGLVVEETPYRLVLLGTGSMLIVLSFGISFIEFGKYYFSTLERSI